MYKIPKPFIYGLKGPIYWSANMTTPTVPSQSPPKLVQKFIGWPIYKNTQEPGTSCWHSNPKHFSRPHCL